MSILNRTFERFIQAREAQADRFVTEYLADRGLTQVSFDADENQG